MKKLGISFAAVRAALVGTSSETTGGCRLGKYSAYYPTSVTPSDCFTPVFHSTTADQESPLGRLLAGAALNNLSVHLTPAMPHTPFAWPHQPVPEYFKLLATLEADAFDDLWNTFPQYRTTIAGVYTALWVALAAATQA